MELSFPHYSIREVLKKKKNMIFLEKRESMHILRKEVDMSNIRGENIWDHLNLKNKCLHLDPFYDRI